MGDRGMAEQVMTVEDAVRWCAEHQAEATWAKINGKGFVVVSCGAYVTQNGTLEEAVHYLEVLIGRGDMSPL